MTSNKTHGNTFPNQEKNSEKKNDITAVFTISSKLNDGPKPVPTPPAGLGHAPCSPAIPSCPYLQKVTGMPELYRNL